MALKRSCAQCGEYFFTHTLKGNEYHCVACKKESKSKPSNILTKREWQIVRLIQQAKSNKIIAYEICLTEGTVKEYLYHIFRKLNVSNRTELALKDLHETTIVTPNTPNQQCSTVL